MYRKVECLTGQSLEVLMGRLIVRGGRMYDYHTPPECLYVHRVCIEKCVSGISVRILIVHNTLSHPV
jgi:hypothetical protein